MPNGTPPAFFLDGSNGNGHRFNPEVIGRGRVYPNEIPADPSCIIKIVVGIPDPQYAQWNLLSHAARIACHVNSDAKETVLQGQIAAELNLQPVDPFSARIATHMGVYPGLWNRHELWVAFGPDYFPLEVWFPVEPEGRGWAWRSDRFPQWNVLGMRGLIDRRMVCITSSEVYAFERLCPSAHQDETPNECPPASR